MLEQLANVIRAEIFDLRFTILEIGALQLAEQAEPFYSLLDLFPGSRIIAFETEPDFCKKMNSTARNGVQYYPIAIGERNEVRKFFITQHQMCCSLYEPNDQLNSLYNNLEVAYLTNETTIETISLDFFAEKYRIHSVDFIKIDIQGAELDVFKGGSEVLKHTLAVVSEVEFISHYLDQPLFGDVCAYLSRHDLMFHKFIGFGGRTLKPIVVNNNPNTPTQLIWSDAMFVRHVNAISYLSDNQLLKLSILAAIYNSPDLSYYCLAHYDRRKETALSTKFLIALAE